MTEKALYSDETVLIRSCLQLDPAAQAYLFRTYAPRFLGLILRYVPNKTDAEDILAEAFCRIFSRLNTFRSQGSLTGWMRRITVNECLLFLRRKKIHFESTDLLENFPEIPSSVDAGYLDADGVRKAVEALPTGYRIVFNLYVVEGYPHQEIAALLGISVNTSKSQLLHAKRRVQTLLGLPNSTEKLSESVGSKEDSI